jgi:hypothetical protein
MIKNKIWRAVVLVKRKKNKIWRAVVLVKRKKENLII